MVKAKKPDAKKVVAILWWRVKIWDMVTVDGESYKKVGPKKGMTERGALRDFKDSDFVVLS